MMIDLTEDIVLVTGLQRRGMRMPRCLLFFLEKSAHA